MVKNKNDLDWLYNSLTDDPFFSDYDEDSEFLEWYSIEGSNRISELSRQLRSYLNYKNAIIRYRFSGSQKADNFFNKDLMLKRGSELFSEYSRYTIFLNRIGADEASIAKQILILKDKVKIQPNNLEINLLKEIKHIGGKMWENLHILSEFELHYHPQLLYMAIKVACILSSTEGVFFSLFTDFYGELKHSYLQLEKELSELLCLIGDKHFETETNKKRVNILE